MKNQKATSVGDPADKRSEDYPQRPYSKRGSRLLCRIGTVAAAVSISGAMLGAVPAQAATTARTTPTAAALPNHYPWESYVSTFPNLPLCLFAGAVGPWLQWVCEPNRYGEWELWAFL